MLPISLDCPFLISPFSNVYFLLKNLGVKFRIEMYKVLDSHFTVCYLYAFGKVTKKLSTYSLMNGLDVIGRLMDVVKEEIGVNGHRSISWHFIHLQSC